MLSRQAEWKALLVYGFPCLCSCVFVLAERIPHIQGRCFACTKSSEANIAKVFVLQQRSRLPTMDIAFRASISSLTSSARKFAVWEEHLDMCLRPR